MSAKLLDILILGVLVMVCPYRAAMQVGQGMVSAERQKIECPETGEEQCRRKPEESAGSRWTVPRRSREGENVSERLVRKRRASLLRKTWGK